MTDFNITGDFAKSPNGSFTEANKNKVWTIAYDADKTGKYYSIVDDARFPNGKACRLKYPKGGVGMNDQFYQIRIKSPQTIINLEFLWLFESDFVFYNTNLQPPQDVGGGKMGPCINWGEVGGDSAKRGTRVMMWWNAQGSNHANPVFSPSCQDQATGNQLIQPVKYSKPIQLDQIYKFRFQMQGGPGGFAKYWITYPGETDETLLADTGTKEMKATAQDDVLIDFAFFSGGAGDAYALPKDCYARHGGISYWSGSSASGSGDNSGGGGGTAKVTVVVGNDTYSGTLPQS